MRKLWIAWLLMIGAVLLVAVLREPPAVSVVSGKVTAVNVAGGKRLMVTVKPTQGQAVALQINPKNTLIMKNDKTASASDIRLGDILKADYEIRRRANFATRLFIQTPQASKPAVKPAPVSTKKARR